MDRSLWPITIVCMIGDVHLNIMVKYSPKRKRYIPKINKVDFFDLPFRANIFNPDSITNYLDATIHINDKQVLYGSVPWSIEAMRDRFNKAIGKWYMTSFSVINVTDASASVIAELIDLISMQDIHPDDGLNEIEFNNFREIEELDEGVLDQLIPLSKKLIKLSVRNMYDTSTVIS